MVPPATENAIYIKLPSVNDLTQLASSLEVFQKILQLAILHEAINGQVVVQGVENGSIWIKVSVGTIAAVNLIAGLTWSAAIVYKTVQEGKEKEQIVKQRIIQNQHAIDVGEFYKSMAKLVAEDEAIHLYNEHFKGIPHDPEQIQRLQHSMQLLSEELAKGAEIQPSIESSVEVIKSFPDLKNLRSIKSKFKRIEDKK